jgi:hypothetical protein
MDTINPGCGLKQVVAGGEGRAGTPEMRPVPVEEARIYVGVRKRLCEDKLACPHTHFTKQTL